MDLGPLAPLSAEHLDEFTKRFQEAVARPGRPIVLPSRGVTCESADSRPTALSCLSGHTNTVPVELAATGEQVAVLCLDCDRQLPAEWAAA